MQDDPDRAVFTERAAAELDTHPHRRQVRHAVDLRVTLDSAHNFFAGSATNLSASGIFVATHIVQPLGSLVELTVHLGDRIVKGVGTVRWIRPADGSSGQPAGMGIELAEIDDEASAAVRAFLRSREPLLYED